MISASEPLEFIPSGREQIKRHPGKLCVHNRVSMRVPECVIANLERVKISEFEPDETWFLRESPQTNANCFTSPSDDVWTTCDQFNQTAPNQTSSEEFDVDELAKRLGENFCKLPSNDEHLAEELYIKDSTVIHTKSSVTASQNDAKSTVCCYTLNEFPIRHALWATFQWILPDLRDNSSNPSNMSEKCDVKNLQKPTNKRANSLGLAGKEETGVCIVSTEELKFFADNGEDYMCSLRFPISKIFNTRFGILVERDVHQDTPRHKPDHLSVADDDSDLPVLFSMSHPHEDFCAVVLKQDTHVSLANEHSLQVIFVAEHPSVCFTFNAKTGAHSLWHVRATNAKECEEITQNITSKYLTQSFASQLHSPISSFINQSRIIGGQKRKSSTPSDAFAGNVTPAMNWSYLNVFNSPVHKSSPFGNRGHLSRKNRDQPSGLHSMAAISRNVTPTQLSLVNKPRVSPSRLMSPFLSSFAATTTQNDVTAVDEEINVPQICLDLLWTETANGFQNRPAKRVALHVDVIGDTYLCYLVQSRGCLNLLKLPNPNSRDFTVQSPSTKPTCRDFVAIPYLNMLASLEMDGQIVLYTGPQIIAKVIIGGVSGNCPISPYLSTAAAELSSPFPRRSSLIPDLRLNDFASPLPLPAMRNLAESTPKNSGSKDSFHKDPSRNQRTRLMRIKDVAYNRLILQYSNGRYFRVHLPKFTEHPLVRACLRALRNTLPKHLARVLLAKWYAIRNAPGDISNECEWKMFEEFLFGQLGYDVTDLSDSPVNTSIDDPKRKRTSCDEGSDGDWSWLVQSKLFQDIAPAIAQQLNIPCEIQTENIRKPCESTQLDTSALLFPNIAVIFYVLHLTYENLKLSLAFTNELSRLARFLHQLAKDLGLFEFVTHYWTDFPVICSISGRPGRILSEDFEKILMYERLKHVMKPVNIMSVICKLYGDGFIDDLIPYVPEVNVTTRDMLFVIALLAKNRSRPVQMNRIVQTLTFSSSGFDLTPHSINIVEDYLQNGILLLFNRGFSKEKIDDLPNGIRLIVYDALLTLRSNPPANWPSALYKLLEREDLQKQNTRVVDVETTLQQHNLIANTDHEEFNKTWINSTVVTTDTVVDGMEGVDSDVLRMRFPNDRRVEEARRLLQSAHPVVVNLRQMADINDHDFIEEQERHLYAVCARTMALPVGRGMFTLHTHTPIITETLSIPKLCLKGKAAPRNATIEMSHIDTPANMNLWPKFHNGVAAGLRVAGDSEDIDATWILFNKPTRDECFAEHSGFLMALGLNGYLSDLHWSAQYEYFNKGNEFLGVGLLLGIAATKRGTMDNDTTRTLGIHIEQLLPPTSMELEIAHNISVAAILGIGLVYQESGHGHMISSLLAEIGRPPGPEMENSVDRESYSLAAGLALGFVTLKQGDKLAGHADLTDCLHYYMIGGNKRPLAGSQKDKYKTPSFQILESSCANLDVTAPGATLALGLMYLGSGNTAIADWMKPPSTQYLLDFVRPDLLMLRVIARCLILWDDIKPTLEWILEQIPENIKNNLTPTPDENSDIDYEAMNQAYFNIVAGACLAIGLKYAGSCNMNAFQTLKHYCNMFVSSGSKSIAELAGRPTIETCLNVTLLSFAMVMAGSGNLTVMRFVRHLRRRVSVTNSAIVTYGSHLVTHMALGLLFLGGGRLTLSTAPTAVAAMLCAFFPKFPTHSNDNRYHLQAFRHLYVLAVEPRLVIPTNALTEKLCYAKIDVEYNDGTVVTSTAPCMLPELNDIVSVRMNDKRYWPVVYRKHTNWTQLEWLLKTNGSVYVMTQVGYLDATLNSDSVETPLVYHRPWWATTPNLLSLSNDAGSYFSDLSLDGVEYKWRQLLANISNECIVTNRLSVLPIWINLLQSIDNLSTSTNTLSLWQLKIVLSALSHEEDFVVRKFYLLSISQQLRSAINAWKNDPTSRLQSLVHLYSSDANDFSAFTAPDLLKLAKYVVYASLPRALVKLPIASEGLSDFLRLLKGFIESEASASACGDILEFLANSLET